MKYLKGTLFLFVVTLCLSMAGVSARQYTQLINIKFLFGKENLLVNK